MGERPIGPPLPRVMRMESTPFRGGAPLPQFFAPVVHHHVGDSVGHEALKQDVLTVRSDIVSRVARSKIVVAPTNHGVARGYGEVRRSHDACAHELLARREGEQVFASA